MEKSSKTDESCNIEIIKTFMSMRIESDDGIALNVQGKSMGPILTLHSKVVVRPLKRLPRFGEIILFQRGNDLVIHRLICHSNIQNLVTKGDSCFSADGLVNIEDVIGLVVGIQCEGRIWVPIHWRRPFSIIMAIWSRFEAMVWHRFKYPFILIHAIAGRFAEIQAKRAR